MQAEPSLLADAPRIVAVPDPDELDILFRLSPASSAVQVRQQRRSWEMKVSSIRLWRQENYLDAVPHLNAQIF